jgi:hypothetical protein
MCDVTSRVRCFKFVFLMMYKQNTEENCEDDGGWRQSYFTHTSTFAFAVALPASEEEERQGKGSERKLCVER